MHMHVYLSVWFVFITVYIGIITFDVHLVYLLIECGNDQEVLKMAEDDIVEVKEQLLSLELEVSYCLIQKINSCYQNTISMHFYGDGHCGISVCLADSHIIISLHF